MMGGQTTQQVKRRRINFTSLDKLKSVQAGDILDLPWRELVTEKTEYDMRTVCRLGGRILIDRRRSNIAGLFDPDQTKYESSIPLDKIETDPLLKELYEVADRYLNEAGIIS